MTPNDHLLLEFAPMEGITTAAFRTAHHAVFGGADRYYTPFINTGHAFLTRTKDIRDIRPENNEDLTVIPQLLSNNSRDFLDAILALAKIGYSEINLNLGCPSPTVVSKHRGSGFLEDPEKLDRFFSEVYEFLPHAETAVGRPLSISVKTRIGLSDPDEAYALMEVYNRYPLSELIIHPRTRKELYSGEVHTDVFLDLLRTSRVPVCYNGDLLNTEDVNRILGRCPETPCSEIQFSKIQAKNSPAESGQAPGNPLRAIMIGRGAIRNPALFRMIRGGAAPAAEEIRLFLDRYLAIMGMDIREERNQLAKLKDIWAFLGGLFLDCGKYLKKIRKAKTMAAYRAAADELLSNCPIIP
jgi:tRNA-dihydrouridine synthase